MRRYRAIIAQPKTETALQVTVQAKTITVARNQLEELFGESAVYNLSREEDAPQLAGDSSIRNRYRDSE